MSRNYRGDVDMNIIDKFMPLLDNMDDEGNQAPIIEHPDATFIFIKVNNIYGIFNYGLIILYSCGYNP